VPLLAANSFSGVCKPFACIRGTNNSNSNVREKEQIVYLQQQKTREKITGKMLGACSKKHIIIYPPHNKNPQKTQPHKKHTTTKTTYNKNTQTNTAPRNTGIMSSSSKRFCVRAPTEIGPDEWSLVTSYLFDGAFESACDLVNMSRVSRTWREVVVWSDWSKAFGFFPLKGQFPRVLVPIMECARDNGTKELKKRRGQKASYSWQASPWTIHREAAKKHLRLNAGSWMRLRAINYEFSRKGGDKRLYLLDDVLREATVNFDSLASLEKRLVRCEKADATREKTRRMREEM